MHGVKGRCCSDCGGSAVAELLRGCCPVTVLTREDLSSLTAVLPLALPRGAGLYLRWGLRTPNASAGCAGAGGGRGGERSPQAYGGELRGQGDAALAPGLLSDSGCCIQTGDGDCAAAGREAAESRTRGAWAVRRERVPGEAQAPSAAVRALAGRLAPSNATPPPLQRQTASCRAGGLLSGTVRGTPDALLAAPRTRWGKALQK